MSKHTKWEYKTIRKRFIDCPSQDWLNKLGKEGWELCGKRDFTQYIFKRKYQDE